MIASTQIIETLHESLALRSSLVRNIDPDVEDLLETQRSSTLELSNGTTG